MCYLCCTKWENDTRLVGIATMLRHGAMTLRIMSAAFKRIADWQRPHLLRFQASAVAARFFGGPVTVRWSHDALNRAYLAGPRTRWRRGHIEGVVVARHRTVVYQLTPSIDCDRNICRILHGVFVTRSMFSNGKYIKFLSYIIGLLACHQSFVFCACYWPSKKALESPKGLIIEVIIRSSSWTLTF